MKKQIVLILSVLLLINFVSALDWTVTPTSVTLSKNYSEIFNIPLNLYNNDNSSNIILSITKSGEISGWMASQSSEYVPASTNKTTSLSISVPDSVETKAYTGTILVCLSSTVDCKEVSLVINTIKKPEQAQSPLIVFPTSKIINVQQGQSKQFNVQLIVPATYPRSVTIQSISFNPDIDVLTLGDLDLGILQPGQTLNIPITAQGKDIQTGTYNTQLNILATDSLGRIDLPVSNLQVVVSVGVNPSTNATFGTRPTCSLSSNTMSVNGTYTMVCTNAVSNLDINPVYNEYFEGINALLSGGVFTYTFKPTKMGTTTFISTFNYKGAPIFSPFSQEVRISSSGSVIAGTNLKLSFSPSLDYVMENQQFIIQLLDDKTNSLVENPTIYIDAVPISPLNQSTKSFPFSMVLNKNYEIRANSPGYSDLVQIINLTTKKIEINITPGKTIFSTGDTITIETNPQNTSLLLNNVIITSPYTFTGAGDFVLKAVKEGYINSEINLTITSSAQIRTQSKEPANWKKGDLISIELNKNATWTVERDGINIISGTGTIIDFKIDEYGTYTIRDGINIIQNTLVEKKGIAWYWWAGIIILVIGVGYVLIKSKKTSEDFSVPIR